MGIGVRSYAMANQDVKRTACVGCGMCAHMCPHWVATTTLYSTPVAVYDPRPMEALK
jgi:Fe-S-cluster-containing hydrogenase component 2